MNAKSGTKPYELPLDISEFKNYHSEPNCKGHFKLHHETDATFQGLVIGPLKLPAIPFVVCDHCQEAFYAPGFQEWVERIIAEKLALSEGSLKGPYIRFMRQFLELTQEALASALETDKHTLSKIENEARSMDFDKQLRLKGLVAEKLGITESSTLYGIIKQHSDKVLKVESDWFDDIKEG